MRITTLNQIFGMLAVTATLCGTETALARTILIRPVTETNVRSQPVGQGPGDMMPISNRKKRRVPGRVKNPR